MTGGRSVLRIEGFTNSNLKTGAPNEREAHQPAAPAHDRRHDGPQLRGEDAERLHPPGQDLRCLPRPIARYGHGRGSAPLPAAPDRGRRPPADHQQRGLGPAVLLLRHGGPARRDQAADVRRRAAQDPRRVEPQGGGALSGGGAWAEVQGCPECRLRRGPARVRGRCAQGQRRRFQAHVAQDRAGQGTQGSLCNALAAAARAAA